MISDVPGSEDSPEPEPGPVQAEDFTDLGRRRLLYAALARVQGELPRVVKLGTAKVKSDKAEYSYKYADLTDVTDAIMPVLSRHGLAFVAAPTLVDRGMVLAYRLVHEAGGELTGQYPVTGQKPQDIGSSITYARRYALCAVTGVAPGGDDDDAQSSNHTRPVQQADYDPVGAELNAVKRSVMDAYAREFGQWHLGEAQALYAGWAPGGSFQTATAGDLRRFVDALRSGALTPPAADEPEHPDPDPEPEPVRAEPPLDDVQADAPGRMSGAVNVRVISLLRDQGITDRAARVEWMSRTLGRQVASSREVSAAEGQLLLEAAGRPDGKKG